MSEYDYRINQEFLKDSLRKRECTKGQALS